MPLTPALIGVIAANLVPLAGVVLWGWDAFLLLLLYWLETVAVAFWTLVRLLFMPQPGPDRVIRRAYELSSGNVFMAAFFAIHAGGFMWGHLYFLTTLFSGEGVRRLTDISIPLFVSEFLIGDGLWLPLAIMFAATGWAMFFGPYERDARPGSSIPASREAGVLAVVLGLYVRIIVLHAAIILAPWGLWLAGSAAPLALVILFKTLAEIYLVGPEHLRARMRAAVSR